MSRSDQTPSELWQLAHAYGDRGRVRTAARVCERALRHPDLDRDSGIHAQVLISLACYRSELGDAEAAMHFLDEALAVDPRRRPAVLTARGMILLRNGHPDTLRALDEAIDAMERLSPDAQQAGAGPSDLAAALLNRGLLHMSHGRLSAARRDTRAAEVAAVRSGRRGLVHMARHNLGYIQYLEGDLPGALRTMADAAAMLPESDLSVPSLDRAQVLVAAGLITEALEYADRAVKGFRSNRARPDLAQALLVKADLALRSGDARGARRFAGESARILNARGNTAAALAAELVECRAAALVRSASDGRDTQRAAADEGHAADLASRLTAAGLVDDAVVARMLQLQAALDGEIPRDSEELESMTGRAQRSSDVDTRMHGWLLAARADIAGGRVHGGVAQIRRGLDELAHFQSRFGSQDLQSGAAVHGRELAALGLRTAVAGGSPAAILQWLERSRAVSTRLPEVRPPADPALAEELGALRVAFDQARQAALAGRRDAALDRRVAELRRRVRSRSWTASGSGAVLRPPSLAAVRRALAPRSGTSVLALFHGDGHDHALAITARGARYRRLGESPQVEAVVRRVGSDLDLLADVRIPLTLRRVARASLGHDLARLSKLLIEPMLDRLDDGPLLIVDAGPTAAAPWALLPALHGRAVSVTSSVTRAIAGLAGTTPAHERGVLVVSGPNVDNGEKEAQEVANRYPEATQLTGADATGAAVLAAVPDGGLLHVAAHGHHEPDSPLFSGLMLSDGLLFGYDVAPNPALPAHVVLSSCDVGRSDDRPGGEPLGLVAALVRSGVRTVIASTSRLADDVAAPAMIVYHEAIAGGADPARALADAVVEVGADTDIPVPLTCFGAGVT